MPFVAQLVDLMVAEPHAASYRMFQVEPDENNKIQEKTNSLIAKVLVQGIPLFAQRGAAGSLHGPFLPSGTPRWSWKSLVLPAQIK